VPSEELTAFILGKLDPLPVTVRRMFGMDGLYLGGTFFGVVSDGRLYFRTDDESRADCLERGMQPLQPKFRRRGPKTVDRHFEVPQDVIEDAALLNEWAARAAAVKR
jgi:TfoX/Sxy family transcriptional regulator of competence genes